MLATGHRGQTVGVRLVDDTVQITIDGALSSGPIEPATIDPRSSEPWPSSMGLPMLPTAESARRVSAGQKCPRQCVISEVPSAGFERKGRKPVAVSISDRYEL